MKLSISYNGEVAEVGNIATGDNGVVQTIAVMQALVDHAVFMAEESGAIKRLAQTLVDASGGSVQGFASQLYDYCQRVITFKADPDGVELIRTPGTVITQIIKNGKSEIDCDDLATFAAAIIAAAGYEPLFFTAGQRKSGRFEHVHFGIRTGPNLLTDHIPLDPQEKTPKGELSAKGQRYKVWALKVTDPSARR